MKYDLEERLVKFCAAVINVSVCIKSDFIGEHLSKQLARSATSAALNYGEAQTGASKKDFIYRMTLVLKELRETFICLKIIKSTEHINNPEQLELCTNEANQLISIFVKSIHTAKQNQQVATK